MNQTTVMMPCGDGWTARSFPVPQMSDSEWRRFQTQKRRLARLIEEEYVIQNIDVDSLSIPAGAALADDLRIVREEIYELRLRMPRGDALSLLHPECVSYGY